MHPQPGKVHNCNRKQPSATSPRGATEGNSTAQRAAYPPLPHPVAMAILPPGSAAPEWRHRLNGRSPVHTVSDEASPITAGAGWRHHRAYLLRGFYRPRRWWRDPIQTCSGTAPLRSRAKSSATPLSRPLFRPRNRSGALAPCPSWQPTQANRGYHDIHMS